MELKGLNYLIVGGGSGIGYALASDLLAQGANVFVAGRNQRGPAGSVFIEVDVLNFTSEFDSIPDELHGIAYCPGSITLKPIQRISREDLIGDFEVNVVGAFKVVQSALRKLKKANGASIVFFSTVAAGTGMGFHTSISAAKGALEAMAKSLAAELASSQIRVNVIAPSLTQTPLASQLLSSPEKLEASAKRHPLGRVGQPEDMASAAAFFLSPKNSWITGQILGIDGGLSAIR